MGTGLERRAWPLNIEAYEAADDGRLLRLFYVPPGGTDEPGGGVAEVRLAETNDAVTIALIDRRLSGTYPDGAEAAVTTVWQADCLAVTLAEPVGTRAVVDGATGKNVRRLARNPSDGSDDYFFHAAVSRGCPVWVL